MHSGKGEWLPQNMHSYIITIQYTFARNESVKVQQKMEVQCAMYIVLVACGGAPLSASLHEAVTPGQQTWTRRCFLPQHTTCVQPSVCSVSQLASRGYLTCSAALAGYLPCTAIQSLRPNLSQCTHTHTHTHTHHRRAQVRSSMYTRTRARAHTHTHQHLTTVSTITSNVRVKFTVAYNTLGFGNSWDGPFGQIKFKQLDVDIS